MKWYAVKFSLIYKNKLICTVKKKALQYIRTYACPTVKSKVFYFIW